MRDVAILGAGYTGGRAAARLLDAGARVLATARGAAQLTPLRARGAETVAVDAAQADLGGLTTARARLGPELAVLCLVPPVAVDGRRVDRTAALLAALAPVARVVYVSSTSVYGDRQDVDERTPPAPTHDAARARLEAEAVALGGPWSGLVLRAPAIYGPGRGIHAGPLRRALDPDAIVSRIHVDDLATLCVAALGADATGAWPVADEEPASPSEVATFCRSRGIPVGPLATADAPRRGRRVDGSAVRALLGCELEYPSYRTGIPASLRRRADP